MINSNDQLIGRQSPEIKLIRSEVIRVRFTKEERSIIEFDCKSIKSPYISTYLREYYFKTRSSELVVINSSTEANLKNIENVISAQSKLNNGLSILKKYANSSQSLTFEQNTELYHLLEEVMDELHTIKARLRG